MSLVTVLGAAGAIQAPFDSSIAANIAQTLIAKAISAGILNGTVFPAPYNTTPPLPNGFSIGEDVITTGGNLTAPVNNTDIVNVSTAPTTITGSGGAVPYQVLAGTGGTSFFDASSLGGNIAFGGGSNTIAGSSSLTPLQGNWFIDVGSARSSDTNFIQLGHGADTVLLGGQSSVIGGGSGTFVVDKNTDATDPAVVLGKGNETVTGAAGGHMLVGPASLKGPKVSGADQLFGGKLGHDTIIAPIASGVNTVIGGGPGDVLFSSDGNSRNVFFAGPGNETVQAAAATANQTIYGGKGHDVLSGGKGNDIIDPGSGSSSIWTGAGHDSVWFVHSLTGGKGATDILMDFNTANDKFLYTGYDTTTPFTVATVSSGQYAGNVEFTMSDGTKVIFATVTDSSLIQTQMSH